MKILHISSSEHFGGGERHLADLTRGLVDRGHEIHLAVRNDVKWPFKLGHIERERLVSFPLRGALDLRSAFGIARYVRRHGIEIVHAHPARDYTVASFAVRAAPRTRLVITRHVLFKIRGMTRIALGNVSRAIAVSAAVAANLQRTFPPDKIVCIYNGLDFESWDWSQRSESAAAFRSSHGIPADAFLVGTVGELNRLKGQEEFVIAANEIRKGIPDAFFLCVGDDSSPGGRFRSKLRRLVKTLGLEDRFLFLDWIDDLFPMFSSLDVFVSASHTESFGLAILEAMGAAKPVVSTRTAGALELVEHRRSGILVDIRDPLALADAVRFLHSDRELRKKMGDEARRVATEKFSSERMIESVESLYREVLDTQ